MAKKRQIEDFLKNKIRLARFNTKIDENSFVARIIENNTIQSYDIERPTDKIGKKFYITYNVSEQPIIEKVILDNIKDYLWKCFIEDVGKNLFFENLKELQNETVNIGYFIGMNDTEPKNRVPIQFYFYELKTD